MVDALVAVLAGAIAGKDSDDWALFVEYEAIHWPLAWNPLLFLIAGVAAAKVRLRHLPATIRQLRQMRGISGAGGSFSEEDVDAALDGMARSSGLEPGDPALQSGRDWLRNFLLGDSWRQPEPGPAKPPS